MRNQVLFKGGHVAQAKLDIVTSSLGEATARHERATRSRDLSANRLSYTTLVAPADGVVTHTMAEAGQIAGIGQPVLTLARMDRLDVEFALPEQKRETLDGAKAVARLWGQEGDTFALSLREVSPDVIPATRTYTVRMAIVGSDSKISLGRTVIVDIASREDEPVATVPLAAILNDGAGPAVWRIPRNGHRVERVGITLAALDGKQAVIRGALSTGDIVISLGASKIDPARPVRVIQSAPVRVN